MNSQSNYLVFDGNDEPYFDWMEEHPEGFILNVIRSSIIGPIVVHRSNCGHIRRGPGMDAGAFTTRGQFKVASLEINALLNWSKYHQPEAAIKYCQTCDPV